MHTGKNTHKCKYCVCVCTCVLPKKPTHVWFTPRVSHVCDTCRPFKLWVICTVIELSNTYNNLANNINWNPQSTVDVVCLYKRVVVPLFGSIFYWREKYYFWNVLTSCHICGSATSRCCIAKYVDNLLLYSTKVANSATSDLQHLRCESVIYVFVVAFKSVWYNRY